MSRKCEKKDYSLLLTDVAGYHGCAWVYTQGTSVIDSGTPWLVVHTDKIKDLYETTDGFEYKCLLELLVRFLNK